MAGQRKLKKAYKRLDKKKANEIVAIPGILGFPINGVNTVEVRNRSGYVYVRLRDNQSEVVQAFNTNVSPVYGLPVLITRDKINKSRYSILSRDIGRYENWGTSSPYLPRHGAQHSFDPTAIGGDIVWVYNRQFMPLNVYPSGSSGSMNVLISPTTYYRNGLWHYAGETGTASFAGYKPTGTSARMVLVSLDSSDNPQLTAGNLFASTLTGTSQIFSYIPQIPTVDSIPIAAIRLVSGTSVINWDNIYDVRPFFMASGFNYTGTSGHVIADEGTPLTNRPTLNFVGTNVWAQDDAGNNRTNIIVSGTAGGGGDGGSLPDMQIGFGDGASIVGDSVFLYDTGNRTISLGYTSPTASYPLELYGGDDEAYRTGIMLDSLVDGSSTTWHPLLRTQQSRGTSRTRKQKVTNGDELFELTAYGWATGTTTPAFLAGFTLDVFANGTWLNNSGNNRSPTYARIRIGTENANSVTTVMKIAEAGIDLLPDLNVSGTVRPAILQVRYYSFSGSATPLNTQLDSGIGDPAILGKGFTALWNNVGTALFVISSDGTDWFYQQMTKAL